MATCSMPTCGSRVTAFRGSRLSGVAPRVRTSNAMGATGAVMRKEGIHPEWHSEAPVICNGVEVMTVGGTKESYNVDIYSGNHPFYQGAQTSMVMDEGQLNKFKKRFFGDDELNTVAPVTAKAEVEKKKKVEKKKGKR